MNDNQGPQKGAIARASSVSEERIAAVTKREQVCFGAFTLEHVTVDLSSPDQEAVSLAFGRLPLFKSAPELLTDQVASLKRVIGECDPDDGRLPYAERAVGLFEDAINSLSAIIEKDAKFHAETAVWKILHANQAAVRMMLKGHEQQIVAGVTTVGAAKAENERRTATAATQYAEWQSKADEIWSRNPRLSNTAVAKIIDSKRVHSIRAKIRKK
jgi:hypothetical protein